MKIRKKIRKKWPDLERIHCRKHKNIIYFLQFKRTGSPGTGLSVPKKRRYIMKCPYCSQENTRVIDSRPADDNSSIRRRRLCDACGKRFTTYEKIETIPVIVIKKDNNREPYDRSKI